METVYQRLHNVAAQHPEKVAVVAGSLEKTYAEFLADVAATAGFLQARGLKVGEAVGLVLPNGYDFVVVTFAVLAAGGRLVPLNPGFAIEELGYCLDNTDAKIIYHSPGHAELTSYASARGALSVAESELGTSATDVDISQDFDISLSGLYMFSSGSTGKSKRVSRSHANVLAEFDSIAEFTGADGSDTYLCTVPLYHTHGFGNALFASLLSGSKLVILTHEFNARKTAEAIQSYGVSIYPSVPFMLQIMAMTRFETVPEFTQLRLIISAGAPCAAKVHSAFKDKFGVVINELYGSTETGALTLNLNPDTHGTDTCGMPLPGVKIEILSEEGELLPPGEVGEVWVQSPTATSGYDGLPEVTADCFVGGKVFLGDMGKLDDHGLHITGRKKLLVNVAGNKVDPLEVEEVLNQHANVIEAVVVGKPHDVTGEQLKAYIVAEDDTYPTAAYMDHLRDQLVDYKVPRELVHIAEIPKSPVGKILRKYL